MGHLSEGIFKCCTIAVIFFSTLSSTCYCEQDNTLITRASESQELALARELPPYTIYSYANEATWQLLTPYLLPNTHPIKNKLDKLFSESRILLNIDTLVAAGFARASPRPATAAIVTTHKDFKGYVFKIYLDDKKHYYRDVPEYVIWLLRIRGAQLVAKEVKKMGWGKIFSVPKKWIYPLPENPKAPTGYLQKNFILVEEDMGRLPVAEIKKKWKDGTVTTQLLDKLYHIITKTGLRGGCKYDNIPFCKDGKIAFIDTEKNLRWPLPYERLFLVLDDDLKAYWHQLFLLHGHGEP